MIIKQVISFNLSSFIYVVCFSMFYLCAIPEKNKAGGGGGGGECVSPVPSP